MTWIGSVVVCLTLCLSALADGQFFSQSCVPGILEPKNNPYNNNPENLCAICGGTGANKCKPTADEKYQSHDGAFRCLVEDAGDVAFTKHTTVDSNTGGRNTDSWARNLQKEDYQLLCPDGTRADVDDWMKCSLAKAPSHTVVTAAGKDLQERQELRDLLIEGQNQFKDDSGSGFKMFDSEGYGQDGRDLLFKDSTLQLVATTSDNDTYETFISKEYQEDIKTVSCKQMPGGSAVILPSFLLILAALGAQRLLNRG